MTLPTARGGAMHDDPHAGLRVLMVEDDDPLRLQLRAHLTTIGWNVTDFAAFGPALAHVERAAPDVALLDINLPDGSGLALCLALRERYGAGPGIMMLTGLGSEDDVVAGLEQGADDYLVKPCRPREVIARVRALSRRVSGAGRRAEVAVGGLSLDVTARTASVGARTLELTVMEFELLRTLATEPERAFSRIELLTAVWGTSVAGYARNVDCHVVRLRKKLADAGAEPVPIRTVRGVGYAFRP